MINYSIIIDCPDCYLDILEIFFAFLNKNWPTRKQRIFITTENLEINHPENVEFVKCGSGKNSIQRTKEALKRIKDEFVLIIDCDDFIGAKVNDRLIDNLLVFSRNNNISYIRVWKFSNFEQKKYKTDFKSLYFCNKKARYAKSLMANFWQKNEYLKIFASDKDDGWTIESKWLQETYFESKGFYPNYCYYSKNPFNIVHAVRKGKWIRSAYNYSTKHGISKEMLSKRDRLAFFDDFMFRIRMFFLRHMSSRLVCFLKRISHKRVKYVSKY